MLMGFVAAVAVVASGWCGRYELPIGVTVVAGLLFSFATTAYYPAFGPLGLGLVCAYLRRRVLLDLPKPPV